MNYSEVLQELGLTQDDMDKSKNTLPLPMLSSEEQSVYFGVSNIEGDGTFAIRNIKAGETIAPFLNQELWTLTGMLTNHSENPNAEMIGNDIIASKNIDKHSEVLVDYLQIKEALL